MGLADELAGRVKKRGTAAAAPADDGETEDIKLAEGDIGKRILAAIAQKDAIALENAIHDCVSSEY